MASIHVSMAGEGRGHATRARALCERLAGRHELTAWAGGDATALFARGSTRPLVVPRFAYRRDGRLGYVRTGVAALGYLRRLPGEVLRLERALRAEGADLAVADLEPALPRAAARAGLPYLSLSHQRLLVAGDFSFLPRALHRRVRAMAAVVRWLAPEGDRTVVSSFYAPPLAAGHEHVQLVGVLLRADVLHACPSRDGFVLAYFRRPPAARVLDALEAAGREVRVYGAGVREDEGLLRFRALDAAAFAADLAACDGLVCSAGNQLLGEARHLRKPVLAIPEAGNFEQLVNAHLLALSGGGAWVAEERLDGRVVAAFAERLGDLAGRIERRGADGTAAVVATVEELLVQKGLACGPSRSAEVAPSLVTQEVA